jgi:hypothetical protein
MTKTGNTIALLRGMDCPHGFEAVYCASCFIAAADKVEENDELSRLKRAYQDLSAAFQDHIESEHGDISRYLDKVERRLGAANLI